MLATHSAGILAVLDAPPPEALRELQRCRKIGPKSAEKFKSWWEASFAADGAGGGGGAGTGGPPAVGLRVADLLTQPPQLGFEWGPNTRCYTPALHQVRSSSWCYMSLSGLGVGCGAVLSASVPCKWVLRCAEPRCARCARLQAEEVVTSVVVEKVRRFKPASQQRLRNIRKWLDTQGTAAGDGGKRGGGCGAALTTGERDVLSCREVVTCC